MKTHLISLLLAIVFVLAVKMVFAQVAINTDGANPDGSAMLDLKSTTKGFLVPRLTSDQKSNISQPATGLMIYQTDGTTGFYYNRGTPTSPDWLILSSSSTSVLWVRSPSNTSTVLLNPTDSVAIGRSMPVEKLDVKGNLDLDNFQPLILFREDSLEAGRIQHIGSPMDGFLQVQAWDGNHFETTGLVVKSPAQNVGIGTTTPGFKLDVAGTTRMSGLILSTATQDGFILTSDVNGIGSWKQPASHLAGSGTTGYLAKFAESDTLADSEAFQSAGGNIGIGTNSPATKLDVNGQVNMRDNIRLNGNWLTGDGNDEGVFVAGDGKVGVGTSSPASAFTSGGMIQTMAGGVKFPDNTVQTTAATQTSVSPRDGAEPRWVIGMEMQGIQGSWTYQYCNNCSRVFDLDWYLNNTYDETTGQLNSSFPQHHEVSILKDIDKTSVELIRRLHNQQPIDQVRFHFYYVAQGGIPSPNQEYYIIELTDVMVIEFRHSVELIGSDNYAHMDKVNLIYHEINWQWLNPSDSFQDQWGQ